MALIFFRLWRKLVKMKFSFPWNLPNPFFPHMHLKTTSLLKGLPRAKLEVRPFRVLEIHCPLCLRPDSALGKSELQAKQRNKQKKQVKDVLNLRQETMKSLSIVWIYVCLSVPSFFSFFFNAEVINEF